MSPSAAASPIRLSFSQSKLWVSYSPLQKREGTGAIDWLIDEIENLNIKTEMLMNEKLPDQV